MITRIAIVLVLQTLVLIAMVGMKQWTLTTGMPILLETEPIDPRSLFRGDYVRLKYVITEIQLDQLDGDDEFDEHDVIYIVLQQGDTYWEPIAVHNEYPTGKNDKTIIKGEVKRVLENRWNQEKKKMEPDNYLQIRYGIENYFVPEGEGRELEIQTTGKVDIRVAVDKFGNAGIKAVLVDGKERYVETLL